MSQAVTRVETFRACRNLVTPHVEDAYPGHITYRPPGWTMLYLCPAEGATFVARGGESTSGYALPSGVTADGFTLEPGDRATVVTWLGPQDGFLATWRVERART